MVCSQHDLLQLISSLIELAASSELLDWLIYRSDKFPLVVRLPCHKDHIFDYECIRPWLKLNPTCPLDRKQMLKAPAKPPPKDEDDSDWDDMYA
jgi:hypothetical protein